MNQRMTRILCVDDEPLNLNLLEAMLSPRGYDVVSAANGPEALEKIAAERIDICLLDVMMPGMDGFEVCRRIKSDDLHRSIPVVMITSHADTKNRIRGIEAGAEDFISKPFDSAEVLARIKMLLHVKSLNEQLQNAHDKLEAANIELEAFNYSVTHDLRRPLTNINGYCQVVKQLCGDKLDEQSKEYIQKIYDGTLRMNGLIDTLLRFSLVTRVEIRRETIDLSAMAKAVATELELAEPERRVTFRIAEGVTVNGDAGLWRIVLDNLIGNAWKYTGKREETVIEFGVTEVDRKPACFVRDNGPGFDMAFADKLFIPFQQLPGTKVEGHGIGLATVERIVRRHGGRVWAESEPGMGATFLFTLE
jgi:light-regulated signal transduction histidine kinase (bacteriophytochrome)